MKICANCKKEKEFNCFYKQSRQKDGLNVWCKVCHTIYEKEKLKNNPQRKKYNQEQSVIRAKEFIWNILINSKCAKCNISDPRVLEFDHINQKEKQYNISEMFRNSIETIQKEIDKCQILCANCHRIKTGSQFCLWRHEKFENSQINEINKLEN